MNSKRVALFLSYLGGGGAERVMLNLAKGFLDSGLQVDLILAKAWGPHLWKVPSGVTLVDLGASRPLLSLPNLVRYLGREQPAALIAAMHYANELAIVAKRLARVDTPIIVTEHNTLSRSLTRTKGMKQRLIPLAVRHLYPLADKVVAVSQGARHDLEQLGRLSPDQLHAIYNPVITPDLEGKATEAVEHPWLQPGQWPVILGVGKLEPQKDFPTLIRAFAQVRSHRPCRLAILGWGPGQEALQALIDDLGIAADAALLGYVENPYAYMARAQAFVLSSAWEGLPTVLIEAMALGLPVISTDCKSGPDEILKGGQYGPLVPVGDSDAIAEAIDAVLDGNHPTVDQSWLEQFKLQGATQNYLKLFAH
ncbi:Glycosyltransferase type 1 [Halomicronema hongdechloris C2206]|uniref:Glycosyltransferase type 1 n=1 Tax=Halomicronema hongdechloris C2206 TaxID=1641165 RepID=A0A1Z3HKA7_9CYAN|nr:glycosyltransferase [Halomicronema hongdechloris]ASC70752.1 Glycosyltransferase type 1 [Halomicronema hongdechloris C2206]